MLSHSRKFAEKKRILKDIAENNNRNSKTSLHLVTIDRETTPPLKPSYT